MKAVALEVKNDTWIKYLEIYATDFYLAGFFVAFAGFITLLTSCIAYVGNRPVLYIVNFLFGTSDTTNWVFLFSMTLGSIIFLFINHFVLDPARKGLLPIVSSFQVRRVLLPAIIGTIFVFIVGFNMVDGDVIVKMDDVYNKQNEQIPIEITITGVPTNDVVISLSKVNSNNDLIIIDSLKVKSDPNSAKICSSTYLTGNNLDLGKYKIFVNCTNLTKGYYELSVSLGEPSFIAPSVEAKTNSFYLI
jgi:5-hydroxyisourate hydrolase-like protein (transthyretin family)